MHGTSTLIVTDADGTVRLHPEREAKLAKELEEIDRSEQYALIASLAGDFPCFSCLDGSPFIFLNKGEVWKYGSTRKGESLRYPGRAYGASNVIYVVQFKGDYAACLKEEKRKIYHYPTLPEARARPLLLPRPPGNKNDN